MTQIVMDVDMSSARNTVSSSFGRQLIDDVTKRWRTTSGRHDTEFQSIEKRFRADLSRRLHDLRVQVEESRGRVVRDPAGMGEMPTIAVKPPLGAWMMRRPSRRRCVSYQPVTHAVNSLTMLSTRGLSSSVPAGCRLALSGVADSHTSLTDDPFTSPEVARSRDSMTSSTSDLSAASVRTVSDSELSATNVGGGNDVIAIYSTSDSLETAQCISSTRVYSDDVEGPAHFASRPSTSHSYSDKDGIDSNAELNTLPVVCRPEIDERTARRYDNAGNPPFEASQRHSLPTLEDLHLTLIPGSPLPSHVPDVTQRRPEMAASAWRKFSVDVVSTSLSSAQGGTGSSLRQETMIDTDIHSRSETVDSAVTDDVLQTPVRRGQYRGCNKR